MNKIERLSIVIIEGADGGKYIEKDTAFGPRVMTQHELLELARLAMDTIDNMADCDVLTDRDVEAVNDSRDRVFNAWLKQMKEGRK